MEQENLEDTGMNTDGKLAQMWRHCSCRWLVTVEKMCRSICTWKCREQTKLLI